MRIALSDIRIDGDTQPPNRLCDETVERYATILQQLPPVVIFHDGGAYWLADGFHRFHAARMAGAEGMDADVRKGTRTDARLFAASANAAHGKVRTRAELQWWIDQFLNGEGKDWSDRRIAEVVGCSPSTVATRRPKQETLTPASPTVQLGQLKPTGTRTGINGKQYTAPPSRAPQRPSPPASPGVPPVAEGLDIMRAISDLKSRIVRHAQSESGSWLQGSEIQDIESVLDQVRGRVRDAQPTMACPQMPNCKRGCKLCEGRKFLSKRRADVLPKEERP
jgi:hypothetical protein